MFALTPANECTKFAFSAEKNGTLAQFVKCQHALKRVFPCIRITFRESGTKQLNGYLKRKWLNINTILQYQLLSSVSVICSNMCLPHVENAHHN